MMFRRIRAFFAWERREIGGSDVWSYWENRITGERKAYREMAPVCSPIRLDWLEQAPFYIIVDVRGKTRRKGRGGVA